MKINTKLSIAVHTMLCIAFFEEEGTTSKTLAKSVSTNPTIIRRILIKLKKSGFITINRKGSRLIKDPSQITVLSIYKAIYSDKERSLFNFHNPNHICPVGCAMLDVLHEEFDNARITFEKALSKITIESMIEEIKIRKKHISFMNKEINLSISK